MTILDDDNDPPPLRRNNMKEKSKESNLREEYERIHRMERSLVIGKIVVALCMIVLAVMVFVMSTP